VIRDTDRGVTWTLIVAGRAREAARGIDLEIDVPRFVYEMLHIDRNDPGSFRSTGILHILSA